MLSIYMPTIATKYISDLFTEFCIYKMWCTVNKHAYEYSTVVHM